MKDKDIEILSKLLQLLSSGYSFERSIIELFRNGYYELREDVNKVVRGIEVNNEKLKIIRDFLEAGIPIEKIYTYFEETVKNLESMREVELIVEIYKWRGKILISILSGVVSILSSIIPCLMTIMHNIFNVIRVSGFWIFLLGLISVVICSYYMSIVLTLNVARWLPYSAIVFSLIYILSKLFVTKTLVGL